MREDLKLYVCLHSVSRSGPLRIDAAVMLWAATHLDLWAGLGNIAASAVVRNGSRYGRRSGSPRLRNSCRITWISPCPFELAAPGVSREKPPRVSGCSSARVTSRPRSAYRTVRRWHEQLPFPHRPVSSPGQGAVAFCQRRTISAIKQDLVSRDVNYSSPPYSDESLNPTRCGCESRL